MKIIRLCTVLDFGGLEQRLVNISKVEDEHEWVFCALGNGGAAAMQIEKNGKRVVLLETKYTIPSLQAIRLLVDFFNKERPDVVHTSGAEANFHGLIAARVAGVPIRIGEEIGLPNHRLIWRLIFRLIYKNATRVISISEAVKDRIVGLGEVDSAKVEVVYNPVSIHHNEYEFSKTGPVGSIPIDGSFVFVTTCRLVKVKNLLTLVEVFAAISINSGDEDLVLWIIGDGVERDNLEKAVERLGISEKVKFLGFQPDVIPFLKAADVFVLPSFSEGFSISLVEAMLCELLCVVTDQGGPSEIIENQVTGYLVNPYDQDQIRDAMVRSIRLSNKERVDIGNKAYQSAMKYSLENHVKRLMEVYVES